MTDCVYNEQVTINTFTRTRTSWYFLFANQQMDELHQRLMICKTKMNNVYFIQKRLVIKISPQERFLLHRVCI